MSKNNGISRIDEDIANNALSGAYLLYGEETYLLRQYKNKIINALFPEKDTMNCSYFSEEDADEGKIIDLAETMPFFAEKRLIVVTGSGFFKKGSEKLSEYLKEIPDYLVIIFCEKEVDKRTAIYKTASKNAVCVEFTTPTDDVLVKWIIKRIKDESKKISKDALNIFMEKCGQDMEKINTELEKLIMYCYESDDITIEDVNEICSETQSEHVFLMLEAMVKKDREKAIELYLELLENKKEKPIGILARITWQLKVLWQIKQMSISHVSSADMARQMGYSPYMIRKNESLARRFSADILYDQLSFSIELEEGVKSGKLSENVIVEMMIDKCCK